MTGKSVLIWEHPSRAIRSTITGFRRFSKIFPSLCFEWKVASALLGLKPNVEPRKNHTLTASQWNSVHLPYIYVPCFHWWFLSIRSTLQSLRLCACAKRNHLHVIWRLNDRFPRERVWSHITTNYLWMGNTLNTPELRIPWSVMYVVRMRGIDSRHERWIITRRQLCLSGFRESESEW